MSMEISIERQEIYTSEVWPRHKNDRYDVIIGDKLFLSTREADNTRSDEQILKQWINDIQKQHKKMNPSNKSTKSKTPDLIVGLCALHDHNFTNPPYRWLVPKGSRKDDPYQILLLCAGTHCILLKTVTESGQNRGRPRPVPVSDVLKDFLRYNTVVGVGIEKVAAKMEKDFGVEIPKRVELRDVLEARSSEFGSLGTEEVQGLSLEQMSEVVLEGEMDVAERPEKIAWMSDDFVKYKTVDAFLAHEMGMKLLRRS